MSNATKFIYLLILIIAVLPSAAFAVDCDCEVGTLNADCTQESNKNCGANAIEIDNGAVWDTAGFNLESTALVTITNGVLNASQGGLINITGMTIAANSIYHATSGQTILTGNFDNNNGASGFIHNSGELVIDTTDAVRYFYSGNGVFCNVTREGGNVVAVDDGNVKITIEDTLNTTGSDNNPVEWRFYANTKVYLGNSTSAGRTIGAFKIQEDNVYIFAVNESYPAVLEDGFNTALTRSNYYLSGLKFLIDADFTFNAAARLPVLNFYGNMSFTNFSVDDLIGVYLENHSVINATDGYVIFGLNDTHFNGTIIAETFNITGITNLTAGQILHLYDASNVYHGEFIMYNGSLYNGSSANTTFTSNVTVGNASEMHMNGGVVHNATSNMTIDYQNATISNINFTGEVNYTIISDINITTNLVIDTDVTLDIAAGATVSYCDITNVTGAGVAIGAGTLENRCPPLVCTLTSDFTQTEDNSSCSQIITNGNTWDTNGYFLNVSDNILVGGAGGRLVVNNSEVEAPNITIEENMEAYGSLINFTGTMGFADSSGWLNLTDSNVTGTTEYDFGNHTLNISLVNVTLSDFISPFKIADGSWLVTEGTNYIQGNYTIRGTHNASDSVFVLNGTWNSTDGIFNYSTSTLEFTKTGENIIYGLNESYNITSGPGNQLNVSENNFTLYGSLAITDEGSFLYNDSSKYFLVNSSINQTFNSSGGSIYNINFTLSNYTISSDLRTYNLTIDYDSVLNIADGVTLTYSNLLGEGATTGGGTLDYVPPPYTCSLSANFTQTADNSSCTNLYLNNYTWDTAGYALNVSGVVNINGSEALLEGATGDHEINVLLLTSGGTYNSTTGTTTITKYVMNSGNLTDNGGTFIAPEFLTQSNMELETTWDSITNLFVALAYLTTNNNSVAVSNLTIAEDGGFLGGSSEVNITGELNASGGLIGASALDLDGSSQYAEIADSDTLDITDAITLEAWIKLNHTFNAGGHIIAKRDSADLSEAQYGLNISDDRNVSIISWNGAEAIMSGPIPIDEWVHIAGTIGSDGTSKLYINGDLVQSGTIGAITTAEANVFIGAMGNGAGGILSPFNGKIARVSIFNTTLDQSQIQNIMFKKYEQLSAGYYLNNLTAWYQFDEGSGAVLVDSTGSNNGVLEDDDFWIEESGIIKSSNFHIMYGNNEAPVVANLYTSSPVNSEGNTTSVYCNASDSLTHRKYLTTDIQYKLNTSTEWTDAETTFVDAFEIYSIGDSLIAGRGVGAQSTHYTSYENDGVPSGLYNHSMQYFLDQLMGTNSSWENSTTTLYNYGWGGQRCDWVVTNLTDVIPENVYVLVSCGINDFIHRDDLDEVKSDYADLYEVTSARNNTLIIVSSSPYKSSGSNCTYLKGLADWLETEFSVGKDDVYVVNTYRYLNDTGNNGCDVNTSLFEEDEVHPNFEGHQIIAEQIWEQAFEKILIDRYRTDNIFYLSGNASIDFRCRVSDYQTSSGWVTNYGVVNITRDVGETIFTYAGNSTNLTLVSDISNITNFVIDNSTSGRINFTESVNLTNVTDIDSYVIIEYNSITIDSDNLPNLNKAAILTLSGLTFSSPRILKDGSVCSSAECSQISYGGGELVFTVSSFSSYSAEETPASTAVSVCGDGICSSDESYASCPADCRPASGGAGSSAPATTASKTATFSNVVAGQTLTIKPASDIIHVKEIKVISAEDKASAKIIVKNHASAPAGVSAPPSSTGSSGGGKVYQYLDITADVKIKEAEIEFEVSDEWLKENEASPDEVVLLHYKEENWEDLPTEHISGEEYKATTTEFSTFAISLKSKTQLLVEKIDEKGKIGQLLIYGFLGFVIFVLVFEIYYNLHKLSRFRQYTYLKRWFSLKFSKFRKQPINEKSYWIKLKLKEK